jgi:hypothetical protein
MISVRKDLPDLSLLHHSLCSDHAHLLDIVLLSRASQDIGSILDPKPPSLERTSVSNSRRPKTHRHLLLRRRPLPNDLNLLVKVLRTRTTCNAIFDDLCTVTSPSAMETLGHPGEHPPISPRPSDLDHVVRNRSLTEPVWADLNHPIHFRSNAPRWWS